MNKTSIFPATFMIRPFPDSKAALISLLDK
jgi:hypothetical protein